MSLGNPYKCTLCHNDVIHAIFGPSSLYFIAITCIQNVWLMQVRLFVGEPPFWDGSNEWTIPYPMKILKIFPTKLSISSRCPKGHFDIKFTTLNNLRIAVGVVLYDGPNPDPPGGGYHVTKLLFSLRNRSI